MLRSIAEWLIVMFHGEFHVFFSFFFFVNSIRCSIVSSDLFTWCNRFSSALAFVTLSGWCETLGDWKILYNLFFIAKTKFWSSCKFEENFSAWKIDFHIVFIDFQTIPEFCDYSTDLKLMGMKSSMKMKANLIVLGITKEMGKARAWERKNWWTE